jgi:hypothetical protein
MKGIRFGFALLLLALAIGFSPASVPNSSAAEAAGKCDCYHPNTGKWGIKDGKGECPEVDCWIDVAVE